MRGNNNTIDISKEQKERVSCVIKKYIDSNFDINMSGLEASLLLDFIAEHIGFHYYNMGISDSMKLMNDRIEDMYLLMKDEPINNKHE